MNHRTHPGQDDLCAGQERFEHSCLALRAIVEGTTDAVYAKDKAGRYVQCNASAARFLGRLPEEVIGQDDRMLFPPASANVIMEQDRLVMAQGKAVAIEETLTAGDGTSRTFLTTKGPMCDHEGRVCGVFGISRDITERKQIEDALREAHHAVELAMEGISRLDNAGRYLFVNAQYAELTGYRPEEFIGQSWEMTVHQDDRGEVLALFEHMLATGRGEGEIRGIRKDGSIFHKYVVIVKPSTDQGKMTGHYCFVREITKQKQIEQALRVSEDRFRTAMQGANDGIWDWDIRTNEVYFSERWKTMIGYEEHELLNTYSEWESRLHPDDHARVMAGLTDHFKQKQNIYDVEFRLRKKDGTYCWIQARGKAQWDAEGQPIRMAGSHTDITERKREEALQTAEQRTLELVATGRPLKEVLEFFCQAIEADTAPMLSSVMLVTEDGSHLSLVAGPSLADAYSRLIERIPIGPTVGSCGSAAYFRQPAIVCDIATDPLWNGYAEYALMHGLKACWSQPILSSTGLLLGTFAAYFPEPKTPAPRDLRLLERAGHIASLVIEHARTLEALKTSEERFQAFMQHSPAVTFIKNLDGRHLFVNARFEQLFGMSREEASTKTAFDFLPHETARRLHEDDQRVMVSGQSIEREEMVPALGGEPKFWLTIKFPLETDGGRLLGGVAIDITERKRLERASQDQHDRLRLAMDIAGLAMWDWNILTNQVLWSENCEQVKRLPAGSFEGTFEAYQRLVHPEDLPGLHADIDCALSGEKPYHTEHRIVPPTGEVQWIEGNGVVYRDELGRPIRMVGTVRNITEQKRSEQTLRVNEERYARATAVGQVGVWELDVHAGTYYGDRNLKAMFGYQADELSADPYVWLNVVHPDDQSIAMAHWQRIVKGEADDYQYEVRMVRKDGTVIWTDVRGHAVRDSAGQVTHLIGATLDITRRKQMENALRDSEERLRTLYEDNPSMYFTVASDFAVLSVNQFGARQLGYQPDELIGRSVCEVVYEEDEAVVRQRLTEVFSDVDDSLKSLEFRKRTKSGEIIWVRERLRVLRSSEGEAVALIVCEDISSRKLMETTLAEQAECLKLFFEHSPVSLAMFDREMRYLAVSHRFRAEYRLGDQPLIGRSHYDIFPEIPEHWKAIHRRCLAGAVERCEDDPFLRADGRTDWSRWEIRPWMTAAGEIGGIILFSEDVTARKEAERSQRLFRVLLDQVTDSIEVIDPSSGRFLDGNRQSYESIGYTREDLLNLTVPDIDPLVSRPVFQQHMQHLREAAVPLRIESVHRRKDGTTFPVEVVAQIIRHEREYVVAVVRDITARKRMEDVLKALARGTGSVTGEEFFPVFVKELAHALNVTCATVADLLPDQPGRMKVRSMWHGTDWQTCFKYELAGTPCEPVVQHGTACFPSGVRAHFPNNVDLSRLHAESYAGVLLRAAGGEPLGLIFVIDDTPLADPKQTMAILHIFAARATAELARIRTDEALRESNERFELAVHATNDGIWDWDIPTGRQYWSDRHFELFGLEPDALIPTFETWMSLVHPDDAGLVGRATRRHLETGAFYDIEVRVRMKDGGYRWFRDRGQALWAADGRPVRMVGSISDVTERKQSEEALRTAHMELEHRVVQRTAELTASNTLLEQEIMERKRSEEAVRDSETRYKLLTDATFDGIAVHDQGVLLEVNPGLERMFGYRPGELIGRSLWELVAGESRDQIARNMQTGVNGPYEATGLRKDGTTFPGEVVVRPYRYRGKDVRLVAGRDITARKHLEAEQLRQTEELERQVAERSAEISKLEAQRGQTEKLAAMGRLAAGVAHEINNPIAGIKNAFTLVRQAVDPTHPSAEFAGLIDREISRVASIIQNMYQLCRPETRSDETVDLWIMVKDLEALLAPRLQQRRLKLVVDLMSALQRLAVPRGDLMQVLLNLLTNAVECSPEGGTITIDVREEAGHIQLAVSDQGGGIEPEHLPHIFDPFYTTKTGRDQKGMGLGLSVSQSLVQAMGGTIEVDTRLHRGSTFTIRLPRERVM